MNKRFKGILSAALCLALCLSLFTACAPKVQYEKYNGTIWDSFDTIISVVSYHKNDSEHTAFMEELRSEYTRLNKLYDIYNNYPDMNNAKTINDNAGIAPVKVDEDLFNLIEFSIDWHKKTNGKVNIALGSVLRIWHDVRTDAEFSTPVLPSMDVLQQANQHTDISSIVLDRENMTVFITNPDTKIDIGAVAKGYATELIADKMAQKYESFAISAGGNVKVHGSPLDGRTRWGIGIQNPAVDENYNMVGGNIDLAYIAENTSVVCSGGYQRFFVLDGERYHHLIDPETLYPKNTYLGVTILCEDSGVADVLSTAIFMLEKDEALSFIDTIPDAECILVLADGSIHKTSGFDKYLESCGVTNKTPLN